MSTRKKSAKPRIERAGDWLFRAHNARRRFGPLPAMLAPRSAEEAYAIQAEFVSMRAKKLGRVAGYKIALTTEAMREMTGMNDSVAGDMMEKTLLRSPGRVRAADY